ncbi:hypothetical protein [Nannocystis sp. SCPEA4]|uniref:hypothetical protein n=1 Tax=Nannocystis sp. SCPEA4 TaxID=2996787 RepID=UPI00227173A1|nr:hypothetical protein [Nannocystis sp. SCPEA4]MCY1061806.1 hypothetical protein [Nannocystis sp. SCPEA4]
MENKMIRNTAGNHHGISHTALACLVSLALLPLGCGDDDDDDGDSAGPDTHSDLVYCKYQDGNLWAILCWQEIGCGASPAQVCSQYYSGDLDHEYLWKDSYLDNSGYEGYCNDGPNSPGVDIPEIPPCACDWDDPMGQEVSNTGVYRCTNEWPPPTLFGWPEDYPIPGKGTETETTGQPTETTYVCDDTARTKCVEIWDVSPSELLETHCWIDPPTIPAALVPCEITWDATPPTAACESRCNALRTAIQADVDSHNAIFTDDPWVLKDGNGGTLDAGEPDCSLTLREMTENDVCSFNKEYLSVWGGTTTLTPVRAAAALTVPGGSTGTTAIVGYVGYEVSQCTPADCEITFDALEGHLSSVPGIFTDATGAQTSYVLDDLQFQLAQVVRGQLIRTRGAITFPNEPLVGIIHASGYSLAGVPMGPLEATLPVQMAAGTLYNDRLTLNLAVTLPDGVFTITFQTR